MYFIWLGLWPIPLEVLLGSHKKSYLQHARPIVVCRYLFWHIVASVITENYKALIVVKRQNFYLAVILNAEQHKRNADLYQYPL